jgi:hypothetical protein
LNNSLLFLLYQFTQRPTVCVTRAGAGVDKVWEQKKLEARKILENAAESHTSGARFVGLFLFCKTLCLSKTAQSRLRISVIK